ncbi:MAG: hypothetical protein ACO1OQ_00805, partial [Rufibacter sp.]
MSAEDLDKLFRDKLKNRPVAPSNEAWERLQARMQPPAPQLERKPLTMWYYSAAAAVTLLLGVGFWAAKDEVSFTHHAATVATVQQPAAQKAPAAQYPVAEKQAQPTEVTADFSAPAATNPAVQATEMVASIKSEKKSLPQATAPAAPASIKTKETNTLNQMPAATFTPDAQPAALASAQEKAPVTEAAASPETLEIVVKLDNSAGTAVAMVPAEESAATSDQEERSGTGKVLKGLFKQVKNLKDGEKNHLSELGIAKHT